MAGTPQETPAYVIGSGKPGPVVLVLGGVHGDEPGGWLAAEQVTEFRPSVGALIVIPRANRQAILAGKRTTPELGDLNRLYPGNPQGLPMARMAAEIVSLIERHQVNVLLDLHESWGFYKERPYSGTAFLGQTISAFPNEKGIVLGQQVAAAVNRGINDSRDEMVYREYPPRAVAGAPPVSGQRTEEATPVRAGGSASLGLGSRFPDMVALLVEMGQQDQPLERRVSLHVEVVREVLRALGMS